MPYRAVSACGGLGIGVASIHYSTAYAALSGACGGWPPPRPRLRQRRKAHTKAHKKTTRCDFLEMSLCERLSVLCGVIAKTRSFKPSYGHTALPCGLLQLSLCVPQPSPLCPLCPAEGRMNNPSRPAGGGSLVEPQGKSPLGRPARPPPGGQGANEHLQRTIITRLSQPAFYGRQRRIHLLRDFFMRKTFVFVRSRRCSTAYGFS